jgi:hypothetical protein
LFGRNQKFISQIISEALIKKHFLDFHIAETKKVSFTNVKWIFVVI